MMYVRYLPMLFLVFCVARGDAHLSTVFVSGTGSTTAIPVEAAQAPESCSGSSSNTSLTISAFDTNCTNCFLAISLHTQADITSPSCSHGATVIDATAINTSNGGENIYFYGEAISTASADVVCSWTGGARSCITARSYSGVNVVGDTSVANNDNTGPATVTANSTQANSLVIDACTRFSATTAPMTAGAGQTEDYNIVSAAASSNIRAVASQKPSGSGGDVTTEWTWTGLARDWACAIIELRGL